MSDLGLRLCDCLLDIRLDSSAESLFYKDYNQQSGVFFGGGKARKSVDGEREEGPPDHTLAMTKASDSLTESMKQFFPVSINALFICNMEPVMQPTIFFRLLNCKREKASASVARNSCSTPSSSLALLSLPRRRF